MTERSDRKGCTATTLATLAPFATLSTAARAEIALGMSTRRWRRHEFILRANDVDRDVLFVVSGAVRVCVYSEDGKQVQFEELGPGAMFGELSAIDGGRRSADCFATLETWIARLPPERFRAAMHAHPSVADVVLERLSLMVRRQLQRVFELSTAGVALRIRLELLRLAPSGTTDSDDEIVFTAVPTHADIAARIGTHREAVTRELKSLEAAGLITWRPGTHAIHDLAALAESARRTPPFDESRA